MELNTAIWGTYDDNAQPITSGTSGNSLYYSDKAGAESLLDYYNTYGHNDTIDDTINYWQVADFSSFNRFVYMHLNGNNVFEYTTTKSVKPISIFLAKATPNNQNLTFNPATNSNRLWNSYITGTTAYTNSHKIFPWFNYNRVLLRPSLFAFKLDENGNPTGSAITTGNISKIYNFFHDDENGAPVKDQYVITGLNLYMLNGTETEQTYSAYDYACIATSTDLEVPKPNYYLNDQTVFNTYQRIGAMHIGAQSRQLTLSQTGAYGQDNPSSNCYIYDPAYWQIKEYQVGTNTYRYFAYTGTYEELLRQIATLGFWFRDDCEGGTWSASGVNAKTIGIGCTDSHCFLPEIVNGRTTGNYKQGAAAGADDQATWGIDWRDNVKYRGDEPYRSSGDTGDLTSVFHRLSLGGSLTYYVGTPYAMDSLISTINSGYQPANNDQFVLDFKGTNPADYVCTVMYYPAEFQCPYTAGTFTTIHIGAISPTFPPNLLAQADVEAGYYKEFTPITISPYFYDFRDYAPYTTMSLYVPFCGTVDLDPALFIGHTLIVRLFIDYLTGNCTGVIMRDDTVIDTVSGSCGVSIPLTALNTGNYQNAIKSAEIALKQAEINRKTAWLGAMGALGTTLGGAAMGNPMAIGAGVAGGMGVVTAIQQTTLTKELAEYNLDHIAPAVCNVSAASPCNALGLDYEIHLLIKRCRTVDGFDEGLYAQTVGHACCINDVLGNYSGLTVCSNVKLDSVVSDIVTIGADTFGGNAATADEIALIKQCLNDGVYM